jgi:DNA helicase IV
MPRYIGRIGLFGEDRDADPLLIDWRAPAARPFYLATAVSPEGVVRRRHLRTRGRQLTGIDDEVLDLTAAGDAGGREDVTGEAALLSALTAGRTGRMRDIVETIQSEQDEVIRAGLPGVLVVQGGPGTGKTAVALHRAAYLLFTHRSLLTRQGVLILGPNATFLRYISQVLPSLAETGVLLATLGDLFPGIAARAGEAPAAAALKGRTVMLDVLAGAVRDRQSVPDDIRVVDVDGYPLHLDRATCERARDLARRSGKPHNLARPIFVTEIVHALSLQVAERIGADPLGGENLLDEADLAETRRELREDSEVRAALDELWPVLTPRQLLRELFTSPQRLAAAAAHRPTCRCSTRRPNCSARTTVTGSVRRSAGAGRQSSTPRACWTSWPAPRASTSRTRRTSSSAPPTWWTRADSPNGTPMSTAVPRPNGPRRTGPGSSGTSSWTRPRSCRRWPGAC